MSQSQKDTFHTIPPPPRDQSRQMQRQKVERGRQGPGSGERGSLFNGDGVPLLPNEEPWGRAAVWMSSAPPNHTPEVLKTARFTLSIFSNH